MAETAWSLQVMHAFPIQYRTAWTPQVAYAADLIRFHLLSFGTGQGFERSHIGLSSPEQTARTQHLNILLYGFNDLQNLALTVGFWNHVCAFRVNRTLARRCGSQSQADPNCCASCLQVTLISQGRGEEIVLETRLYDEAKQVTRSMRKKEGLADYRYFPEPDLPPLGFTQESVDQLQVSRNDLSQSPMLLIHKQAGGHGFPSCWGLPQCHFCHRSCSAAVVELQLSMPLHQPNVPCIEVCQDFL